MWAVWALGCFAAAVVGHAAVTRLPLPGNVVAKLVAVGSVLGLVLVGRELAVDGPGVEACAALLVYVFACELYVFAFTMVSSSVSAALLLALRAGSLTEAEIDRRYSNTYMVESRLEKLTAGGFLGADAAGYALTPKARLLTAGFGALRRFFGHDAAVVGERSVGAPGPGQPVPAHAVALED